VTVNHIQDAKVEYTDDQRHMLTTNRPINKRSGMSSPILALLRVNSFLRHLLPRVPVSWSWVDCWTGLYMVPFCLLLTLSYTTHASAASAPAFYLRILHISVPYGP